MASGLFSNSDTTDGIWTEKGFLWMDAIFFWKDREVWTEKALIFKGKLFKEKLFS